MAATEKRKQMLKLRYDVFGAEALGDAMMEGKYEFPITEGVRLCRPPEYYVPFDRMREIRKDSWVHFYVHDKRFHHFLSRRDRYWEKISHAAGFVGIDNSMYRDLPLAEQIHSCYLNRAIDYYLHSKGKNVVANVSWGDYRSYEFCFDGIARSSTVAVSSYGCCRSRCDRSYFEDGFVVMLERLKPYSVLLHGAIWPTLQELIDYHNVNVTRIPSHRETVMQEKGACHG